MAEAVKRDMASPDRLRPFVCLRALRVVNCVGARPQIDRATLLSNALLFRNIDYILSPQNFLAFFCSFDLLR